MNLKKLGLTTLLGLSLSYIPSCKNNKNTPTPIPTPTSTPKPTPTSIPSPSISPTPTAIPLEAIISSPLDNQYYIGTPIQFIGGQSTGYDSCNWDFGNGDSDSNCDTGYTYNTLGSKVATLTVTDENGENQSQTDFSIGYGDPFCNLTTPFAEGYVNQTIPLDFTGLCQDRDENGLEINFYYFTVGGTESWGPSPMSSAFYSSPGDHTGSVLIRDNEGQEATIDFIVRVNPN